MSESFNRDGVQRRIRTSVTDIDRADQLLIHVCIKPDPDSANADIVGLITVQAGPQTTGRNDLAYPQPPQISATFEASWEAASPIQNGLQQIAQRLGGDHFNFYQVIKQDVPTSAAFNQTATPPYVDPPRGGFPSSSPGGNDAIWSDNIPWYHDEILPPGVTDDKDDPFTAAGNVSADGNSIGYYDNPHFDADAKPGAVMEFRTWLVLVNAPDAGATAAYRPVAFLGGFQWQVTKKADGGRTTEIHHRTDTDYPDTSDYEQLLNIPAWFDTDPAHLAPYASASDPKK